MVSGSLAIEPRFQRRAPWPYSVRMEDDGLGDHNCEVCGTALHPVDGGNRCRGCGWMLDAEWVERPTDGDDIPSIPQICKNSFLRTLKTRS